MAMVSRTMIGWSMAALFCGAGGGCAVPADEPVSAEASAFERTEGLDPASCGERCRAYGREIAARCLEAGGVDERCVALGRTYAASCRERLCDATDPRCEDLVEPAAHSRFERCVREGFAIERCEALRQRHLPPAREACDPSRPTCRERCTAAGDAAFDDCVAAGGDRSRCSSVMTEARRACAAEHCDADEPGCEDRCGARARRLRADCVELGGDEARCSALADDALRACRAEFCAEEREPSCEERCESAARFDFADCGDERDCAERVRSALAICTRSCDARTEGASR